MKNFLCLKLYEYPLTSSVQMKTRESGGEANSDQLDFHGARSRAENARSRSPLPAGSGRDKQCLC